MVMLTLLLALIMGLLGGLIGGLLVSRRKCAPVRHRPYEPFGSPSLDREIDDAARQWAAAQGQPLAAPLMAGKLRLLYRLRRRGWSG
jgi:hypothetical protein